MPLTTEQLYPIFRHHSVVSTDSRKITPGCLFFALKGPSFDGNQYAASALDKGAAYAIVDDPSVVVGERYLLVEDVLTSLQDLANYYRRQLDIPILAITGSNGKTTTKELVAGVLAKKYRLHFTQGNYNNHIGVPLTLLSMPADTELAVIEMGANHQGEIAQLSSIAAPSHGLITNIGEAHLEGFGGIEGVKKGKSELYRYLDQHRGSAFVNEDAEFLAELLPTSTTKISYQTADSPAVSTHSISVGIAQWLPHIMLQYTDGNQTWSIRSELMGRHNIENIKTAIAVGHHFGVAGDDIASAVAAYRPENNRSQRTQWRNHEVYLDAYNANPTSMRASLAAYLTQVRSLPILILGDMLELGQDSLDRHQAMVDWVSQQSWHQLLLVGTEFGRTSIPSGVRHFPDVKALAIWWSTQSFSSEPIFIKGSRGMTLEHLLTS